MTVMTHIINYTDRNLIVPVFMIFYDNYIELSSRSVVSIVLAVINCSPLKHLFEVNILYHKL